MRSLLEWWYFKPDQELETKLLELVDDCEDDNLSRELVIVDEQLDIDCRPEISDRPFLYENIIKCLERLERLEEKLENHATVLNYLGSFNTLVSMAFTPAVYGLLLSIDGIISKDIYSKINSLNQLLLTNKSQLDALYANVRLDKLYSSDFPIQLAYDYYQLNFSACKDAFNQGYPVEIKEICGFGWCGINIGVEKVCSYFIEHSTYLSNEFCNLIKDKMCYWSMQEELKNKLSATIYDLENELANLTPFLPTDLIYKLTGMAALISVFGLFYLGLSCVNRKHESDVFIRNLAARAYSLEDFEQRNLLINVGETLKLKCTDTSLQALIAQLNVKKEEALQRRQCRQVFFQLAKVHHLPQEMQKKILLEADLLSAS